MAILGNTRRDFAGGVPGVASGGILGGGAQPSSGILGGMFSGFNPQAISDYGVQNRNALLGLASGLLAGPDLRQGMAMGLQGYQQGGAVDQETQGQNRTREAALAYAKQAGFSPQQLDMIGTSKEAQRAIVAKMFEGPKPRDIKEVGGALVDITDPNAVRELYRSPTAANGPKVSLTPIYGQDAQGNTVLLQPNDAGVAVQTKLPDGIKVSAGIDKLDGGTQWLLIDKRTGNVIGTQPKNNAEAASQTAQGKVEGERIANAPQSLDALDNALKTVEQLETDPNRQWGTGVSSFGNRIPATPGYDYQKRVDQAKGQVFLQAYTTLRGGGQITEQEGAKAQDALARLDTAQSEEAYNQALQDYKDAIKSAKVKLQALSGGSTQSTGVPNASALKQKYGLE